MQAYRSAVFIAYGVLNFTRAPFLKRAKTFFDDDLEKDMKDVHCLITGANTGIGNACALSLASRGASVKIVCRNRQKGEEAIKEIISKTGNNNISLEIIDLSSLEQIRNFAQKFLSTDQPLNLLINNAGCMIQERKISSENLETNFATNVAGTVLLTELLIPKLENDIKSRSESKSKVITVSSGGALTEKLNPDLQMDSDHKFDGTIAYARNKRIQIAITEKWAEKYENSKIGFYAMHPGWVDTEALKHSMPGFHSIFKEKLRYPEEGADTIVWLASKSNQSLINGGFYFDRSEASKHLPSFNTRYDSSLRDLVYSKVLQLVSLA